MKNGASCCYLLYIVYILNTIYSMDVLYIVIPHCSLTSEIKVSYLILSYLMQLHTLSMLCRINQQNLMIVEDTVPFDKVTVSNQHSTSI